MPGDASSNSVESSGDNVLADKWQFIAVTFNTIDADI